MNDELRDRTGELNQVNAYMESILTSLRASVIVVDRDLHIRVWNGLSFEMWGMRAEEVEGRTIVGLDIGFPIEQILPSLRACLSGESPAAVTTVEAVTRRGHPILCRSRVSPLFGAASEVEGVIILIDEVTATD